MLRPAEKTVEVEEFLERLFGRSTSIAVQKCAGCGKPVDEDDFRDELSRKEYGLSALCQSCQDEVFAPWEEDE